MNVEVLRLLVDFGLVVLICLVQLVIYPSFTFMNSSDLKNWHPIYTRRVSYVVLPLMLSQAIIVTYQLYLNLSYPTIAAFLIIVTLWVSTFFQAVPLHSQIDKSNQEKTASKQLVKINRLRLFLWSILFIFSLTDYIAKVGE